MLAEGCGNAEAVAKEIEERLHIHTRANNLAFLQRGGSPSAKDRILGVSMGNYAVDMILRGETHHLVCMKEGNIVSLEIDEGLEQSKEYSEILLNINNTIKNIIPKADKL